MCAHNTKHNDSRYSPELKKDVVYSIHFFANQTYYDDYRSENVIFLCGWQQQ